MSEVKDYSEEHEDNHYNGVSSMYGKMVNNQQKMQPKYCEPGDPGVSSPSSRRAHSRLRLAFASFDAGERNGFFRLPPVDLVIVGPSNFKFRPTQLTSPPSPGSSHI